MSTRWQLSIVFTTAAVAGLFTGYLSGGEFNALAAVVLGLYGGSEIAEKAVNR